MPYKLGQMAGAGLTRARLEPVEDSYDEDEP